MSWEIEELVVELDEFQSRIYTLEEQVNEMSATKETVKSLVFSMKELKEIVAKLQGQVAEIEKDLYDGSEAPIESELRALGSAHVASDEKPGTDG